MLDDLRELYQEVILDHGKRPRNFRAADDASNHAHGNNPLCGDRLTVFVKVDDDGCVADASFVGNGCAISMASASMMTEMIRGKRLAEVETLYRRFHNMCTGEAEAPGGRWIGRRNGSVTGAIGRARVSSAGQMRDAGLAHDECGPTWPG